MSRSKRKTPKAANAGTHSRTSEKFDKRIANRRLRQQTATGLGKDKEILPRHPKEVMDRWIMRKDGKSRFDEKANPKWMRK